MKQALTHTLTLALGVALGFGLSLLGDADSAQPQERRGATLETVAPGVMQAAPSASAQEATPEAEAESATEAVAPSLPQPGAETTASDVTPEVAREELALLIRMAARPTGEGLPPSQRFVSLINYFMGEGQQALAESLLAEALRRWPQDESLLLAGLWIAPQRVVPALEALFHTSGSPQIASGLLNYHQSVDLPRAAELARQILQTQPEHWESINLLAEADPAALRRHYRSLDPERLLNTGLVEPIARALVNLGDAHEAAQLYVRQLQQEPDAWTLSELAQIDPAAAEAYLREAGQRRPGDPSLLAGELQILVQRGSHDELDRRLDEVFQQPLSGTQLSDLAYMLQEQAYEREDAQARLLRRTAWRLVRRAIEQNPYDYELVYTASEVGVGLDALAFLVEQRDQREARGDVAGATQFAEQLPSVIGNTIRDDASQARALAARAPELIRDAEELAYAAEDIYDVTEQAALAIQLFEQALARDPELEWVADRLAELRSE